MNRSAFTAITGCLLTLTLLLAGCAKIPTDSEIIAGPNDANPQAGLRVILPGPADGATPFQIVEGFLKAAIAPQDDYSVARSYLTADEAESWQPGQETVIHQGNPSIVLPELSAVEPGSNPTASDAPTGASRTPPPDQLTTSATVIVKTVASIDDDGRMSPADGERKQAILRLVKVKDQWRISSAPNLTLVAQNELNYAFRQQPVFFLDPTKAFLVPDPHWLPNGGATEAGHRLLASLADGPPAWLESSVVTALPPGVRFARPAVTMDGRIAKVNLSRSAKNVTDQELGLFHDQVRSTLQTVPGVQDVELRAGGDKLDAASAAVRTAPARSTPYVIEDGRVSALAGEFGSGEGTLSRVPGLPSVRGMAPVGLAVDYTSPRFAVLLRNGKELFIVAPDTELGEPVLRGTDLVAPSFDWRGWLWAPTATSDGSITVISPKGEQRSVAASWLQGRTIDAIRVAPDGCRVAIASTDQAGVGRLELAAISRENTGRPTAVRVADGNQFGLGQVEVRSMTWIDPLHLVGLIKRPSDVGPQLLRVEVGGVQSPPLDSLRDVKVVSAGDGPGTLRARDGSNTVHALALDRWVRVPGIKRAVALAYPG